MIRIIKHLSKDLILGIWEIDENIEKLKNELTEAELAQSKNFHPHKFAEFVTSRLLIKAMCLQAGIPYKGLIKDEHGKPFFIDSSFHLSISHSYPMVAGLIHKSKPCGIDIELPREQLLRVKGKFLNPKELEMCADDLEKLCLYWSAKEAIYKIYGRKNLSFAANIAIATVDDEVMTTQVKVGDEVKTIGLFFEKMERYLLVYGYGIL
ncbi:MAG: 4'-phosphopantetheinyl transferase superfamily protein [Reichenbachiella sp.]